MDPLRRLANLARRVPAPRDLFTGRRHPPIPVPDNILLFQRRSARELQDGTFEPHYHHRWVLIAALRGSAHVVTDGVTHRMAPGSLLLLPPLRLHRYEGITRGPLCWLFVTFELDPAALRPGAPVRCRLPKAGHRSVESLLDGWRRRDGGAEASAHLAMELGLMLRRVVGAPSPPGRSGSPGHSELLDRIHRWVETRPAPDCSLPELARALGMSESHLRARFRRAFGLSLGHYLTGTRCRRAALLLTSGRHTVSSAAAAAGFSSIYSFSRTFRRVMGVPPVSLLRTPDA